MKEAEGTVAQQVVEKLRALGPKDDDELGLALGKDRHHVNQIVRLDVGCVLLVLGQDQRLRACRGPWPYPMATSRASR